MEHINSNDRWFATCDDHSLCRVGDNGPITVTQLMPIVKYVNDGDSFLDVGCGSATTFDALKALKKEVKYKGIDFIDHRIEWCNKTFGNYFEVGDARKLNEADKSFDIVWSRHVVDHLGDFEQPIDEHCRVAKKMVICVLWMALTDKETHDIKPIVDGPQDARKTYEDEWTNQYSRSRVKAHLEKKCQEGWQLVEFLEDVTWNGSIHGKGRDTIIVLQRA